MTDSTDSKEEAPACVPWVSGSFPGLETGEVDEPILPTPEVILLLDTSERILSSSAGYAGERLVKLRFGKGLTVHDVLHPGCDGSNCELSQNWQKAWAAHKSGLPVEWTFVSRSTDSKMKLRLQPVSYACAVLFGDAVNQFDDCSVLFIQDTSAEQTRLRSRKAGDDVRVKRATIYQLRRATDSDANIVASLDDRLRTITGRLLISHESERKRIAAELHDGLGQTLSLLRFEIEGCLENALGKNDEAADALQRTYEHAKRSLEELREITRYLHPPIVSDLGLLGALDVLYEDFRAALPEVELSVDVRGDVRAVSDELAVTVYRITQEALNNVARHADARNASLIFSAGDEQVSLIVNDDGVGLRRKKGRGLGMVTMRERAEALGGIFELSSIPGKGVTVKVSWPAKAGAGLR